MMDCAEGELMRGEDGSDDGEYCLLAAFSILYMYGIKPYLACLMNGHPCHPDSCIAQCVGDLGQPVPWSQPCVRTLQAFLSCLQSIAGGRA